MSKRSYNLLAAYGVAVLTVMLATPAAADYTVVDNIAFNARKINPYTGGPAFEQLREVDIFRDLSIRADIPPLNANPLGIAVEALFGISLPELVKLQVGATLAGRTNVSAGYYVSAGRLDISYPASSSLNFQTLPGTTNVVRANDSFRVDGDFQPGVSQRTVLPQFFETEGGAGYFSIDPLRSQTAYQEPWFETQSPWASAWIDASADIQAGVHTKASVLFGLKSWRKDFRGGGQVGGRLVEIDPNGLYVAGEEVLGFDLTQPIGPIPVPGPGGPANLTIQVPNLAVSSRPQSGPVIHARNQQPLMTLTGNLEKLIPFIGPILQNSIGPIGYDLLNLSGGPQIELYQDMTFTPDPKVRLTFSEPVLFGTNPVPAFERTFDLDENIHWTPMFSNSTSITVKPTYLLDNTFQNETGLAVSLLVDVEALSLTGNFPPFNGTLGPIYKNKITVPLFDGELFEKDFSIPLGSVQGGSIPGIGPITRTGITFQKLNLDIEFGLGDLKFDDAIFLHEDVNNPGYDVYNLSFSRSVDGGAPRSYEAQVSGRKSYVYWDDESDFDTDFFEAMNDVILVDLIDPDTNQPTNVGHMFCTEGCDLSQFQPAQSPQYVDPNSALGTLYVNTLPDDLTTVPGVDLDPTGHPVLDRYSSDGDFRIDETIEYATEIIDLRDGPSTTILAQSIHFAPEFDARLGELKMGFASINNSGQTTIHSLLDTFIPDAYYDNPPALYLADESGVEKLVRVGDPAPGGGTIETSNELAFSQAGQVNESGQTAFLSRDFVLYRAGPNEVVEIARPLQSPPEGGGTFAYIYDPAAINDSGQVAFQALVVDSLTQDVALYRGDGNTLTKIARRGDLLPGMNAPLTFFAGFALNNSGKVAFTAANAGGELGVYLGDGSSMVTIGVAGGAAPNGGTFDQIFGSAALNNVDQVAFLARVAPSSGGNPLLGLFRSDGVETAQIAWLGQPLGQGATLSGIFNHYLNDQGQVAFLAFAASGGSEYRAVFRGDENGLLEISRAGLSAPDGNGIFVGFSHEGVFDGLAFNNEGHVAFEARLTQTVGGTSDDDGIFLYDGTNVIQVVREGQALAGSTVVSIAELVAQGLTYGGPLNDNMQLAYTVALADGREVVARFEPSLYWRNPGNGTWGTGSNWSLGIEPINPYDVFVVAENALTVTGPTVNRTVKSLAIGGDDTAAATLNLVALTTLTATKGATIRANGILSGYGQLAGNVTSSGTIRAGDAGSAPKTTMMFNGNVTLESGSKLELDIAGLIPGTQFDRLAITGAAILGGELAASLVGYTPSLGDTFQILTAAGVSGQFDMTVTDLPDLAGNLGWLLSYGAGSVNLSVVIATPGDFSSSGIVGPEDYFVWKANYGSTTNLSADGNHDGRVNAADYVVWRNNLSTGGGSGSGTLEATAPEPATLLLLITGLIASLTLRRGAVS